MESQMSEHQRLTIAWLLQAGGWRGSSTPEDHSHGCEYYWKRRWNIWPRKRVGDTKNCITYDALQLSKSGSLNSGLWSTECCEQLFDSACNQHVWRFFQESQSTEKNQPKLCSAATARIRLKPAHCWVAGRVYMNNSLIRPNLLILSTPESYTQLNLIAFAKTLTQLILIKVIVEVIGKVITKLAMGISKTFLF